MLSGSRREMEIPRGGCFFLQKIIRPEQIKDPLCLQDASYYDWAGHMVWTINRSMGMRFSWAKCGFTIEPAYFNPGEAPKVLIPAFRKS